MAEDIVHMKGPAELFRDDLAGFREPYRLKGFRRRTGAALPEDASIRIQTGPFRISSEPPRAQLPATATGPAAPVAVLAERPAPCLDGHVADKSPLSEMV